MHNVQRQLPQEHSKEALWERGNDFFFLESVKIERKLAKKVKKRHNFQKRETSFQQIVKKHRR